MVDVDCVGADESLDGEVVIDFVTGLEILVVDRRDHRWAVLILDLGRCLDRGARLAFDHVLDRVAVVAVGVLAVVAAGAVGLLVGVVLRTPAGDIGRRLRIADLDVGLDRARLGDADGIGLGFVTGLELGGLLAAVEGGTGDRDLGVLAGHGLAVFVRGSDRDLVAVDLHTGLGDRGGLGLGILDDFLVVL